MSISTPLSSQSGTCRLRPSETSPGRRIEQVHAAEIDAEPETVARASHGLRRNAADHLVPAELEEDEGIGAERLDDGCDDVDYGRRVLCSPGEALGPNANDDVSAVPGGTPGGPLRRYRQGDRFG